MPGVPSGRGCNACRKQKKKCDQSKPKCSRCARLRIPCEGGGEQRYKFQESKEQMIVSRTSSRSPSKSATPAPPSTLSRTPSSETVKFAGALISQLEITDVRYDISCYGPFLREVPKRLGINEALDASACAFTSTLNSIYMRQRTVETYTAFGDALQALRKCLDDPIKAQAPETLCATYLLQICQAWIGGWEGSAGYMSHGEGLAYLLNTMGTKGWKGAFENQMLFAMVTGVLIEAIFNPRIKLKPEVMDLIQPEETTAALIARKETTLFPQRDPKSNPMGSLKLPCLAVLPDLIRQPLLYPMQLKATYAQMRADCRALHDRLFTISDSEPHHLIPVLSPAIATWNLHNNVVRAYGTILCLVPVLNTYLRIFNLDDAQLDVDMAWFTDEVMMLIDYALPLRPVGASYMPLPLVSIWAATEDIGLQERIEPIVLEFGGEWPVADWMTIARWLRKRYEMMRLHVAQKPGHDWFQGESLYDGDEFGTYGSCCPQ